jgi:hypothetical protein
MALDPPPLDLAPDIRAFDLPAAALQALYALMLLIPMFGVVDYV